VVCYRSLQGASTDPTPPPFLICSAASLHCHTPFSIDLPLPTIAPPRSSVPPPRPSCAPLLLSIAIPFSSVAAPHPSVALTLFPPNVPAAQRHHEWHRERNRFAQRAHTQIDAEAMPTTARSGRCLPGITVVVWPAPVNSRIHAV